ncbi:hypothetical protein CMI38_03450 [Candidatus Pacearchaeota archaeon]|jgi:predicted PurR-regulated permease PerM|nr:hypothetical protein [Candidatus Pacearchaeota archaeon]|tara:strand:- start:6623 stop:7654 length:1032 start_codon:yes stop_codon:yes gene_type:complete
MIKEFKKNKKLIVGLISLALLLFVVYASIPFLSAMLGAAIIAYIFYPLDRALRKRGFSARGSALTILIISLILVILPTIFIINGLISQTLLLPTQLDKVNELKDRVNEMTPFNIEIDYDKIINEITPVLTSSITPIFTNIFNVFFILFLLFFLLYYLILYSENIKDMFYQYLPFGNRINNKIINKFQQVTNATIIGTFLIALVQGGLLALNFYMLGIPNALFWGFVTAILSFLPIVGAPIVWVPAAAIFFITGEIGKGIVLVLVGIFISTIDNILRPIINAKYGSVHPVVSIIGIYIGIVQFGILGVFIGPLIIVYLLLFWELYREESDTFGEKKDRRVDEGW